MHLPPRIWQNYNKPSKKTKKKNTQKNNWKTLGQLFSHAHIMLILYLFINLSRKLSLFNLCYEFINISNLWINFIHYLLQKTPKPKRLFYIICNNVIYTI